jgi:hypothetical protein
MQKTNLSQILAVIKITPYVGSGVKNYEHWYGQLTTKENNIYVENEYCDKLRKMIISFFDSPLIHEKALFSDDFKVEEVNKLILDNPNIDERDVTSHFNKIATKKYQVVKPMTNIIILEKEFYKFSPTITLINPNYLMKYLNLETEKGIFLHLDKRAASKSQYYCYLQIEVESKDVVMADYLADIEINRVEHFLRFIVHNTIYDDFGVINYRNRSDQPYFIMNDSKYCSMGIKATTLMKNDPIVICDRFFEIFGQWAIRLHDIFSSKNKNEIWKRICNAVDWIGQSYFQVDPSVAFIQNCFAIESILHIDDDFISKSITAQLSEYIAFLFGRDFESRQILAARFKRLYGVRSKIAHGTKSNAIERDLFEIRELSIDLVLKFLTEETLSKFISTKELIAYIEYLRYS